MIPPKISEDQRPRKAKGLEVPLQNVVHAAGIIDFCEVGKLTVEGGVWGRGIWAMLRMWSKEV